MGKRKEGPKGGEDQAKVFNLTDLEQVRVLADPLRVRIIEQFCSSERTTKQVAEALDEKPTKLYHHVDALEKVGLIRQTRTRRNRGTLERYYRAVARTFTADASLFGGGEPQAATADTLRSMVSTILDTTARELTDLADRGGLSGEEGIDEGTLSFLQIEADERTIARIRRRLHRLLSDLQKLDDGEQAPPRHKRRLLIAFYPLDLDDPGA